MARRIVRTPKSQYRFSVGDYVVVPGDSVGDYHGVVAAHIPSLEKPNWEGEMDRAPGLLIKVHMWEGQPVEDMEIEAWEDEARSPTDRDLKAALPYEVGGSAHHKNGLLFLVDRGLSREGFMATLALPRGPHGSLVREGSSVELSVDEIVEFLPANWN